MIHKHWVLMTMGYLAEWFSKIQYIQFLVLNSVCLLKKIYMSQFSELLALTISLELTYFMGKVNVLKTSQNFHSGLVWSLGPRVASQSKPMASHTLYLISPTLEHAPSQILALKLLSKTASLLRCPQKLPFLSRNI